MLPDMRQRATMVLALAPGVSREYLLQHRVCPRGLAADGRLIVAAATDTPTEALDDLALAYGAPVVTESIPAEELERLIERLAAREDASIEVTDEDGITEDDLTADARDLANQPPVVRYVNLLIREAYDCGASDIHLEARNAGLSARFRLDGVLTVAPEPPTSLHHAIVSRIKLLAALDIAERRRPQDGRIRVRLEAQDLDLRVSTVPTMYGESVVLRLLDRGDRPVRLDELGMPLNILEAMESLARRPHGMILVTGPTGSGKTTTLYAALQLRPSLEEKIITLEDPIEYQLSGITQVPVHRQAGVTFASALRSILRQDPDVIMIGEMRDRETAEIAVQASMTGHLVFSTLHTNDALGAIPRLLDLGVPDYLVSANLGAVLAQRLVRQVCKDCQTVYEPRREQVAAIAGNWDEGMRFTRGGGCATCRGTGFRGRVGVFELLVINDAMKEVITSSVSPAALRAHAECEGMRPLVADGWAKVRAGLTTVEEVLRVVR